MDGNVNERKVFLSPRPIKFHAGRLDNPYRPNVADDANNFDRCRATGYEQCLSNRVFIRKNFFRASLTDQAHVLAFGHIMLVELAAGQKRNSPGPKISGGNVVARHSRTLLDRRHVPVTARIERSVASG